MWDNGSVPLGERGEHGPAVLQGSVERESWAVFGVMQ